MKNTFVFIVIFLLLALFGGGVYYWYFYIQNPKTAFDDIVPNSSDSTPNIFTPLNRDPIQTQQSTTSLPEVTIATSTATTSIETYKLPKLRQLSTTPVSGFVASSTATTSLVRFTDRGTGHIYEASSASDDIRKISNTTLPKIYESYGNKSGNIFVMRYLKDESDTITNFYAELRSTGTSTTETPFELKGKYLSPDIYRLAVSPNGDKVFTWNIENGKGVGYISSLDEKTKVKIADTPLNQVTIAWPEINTAIVTTQASARTLGYMYSIDIRGATMKSVLGGIAGLTGTMSHDGSKILYSQSKSAAFITSIINIKDGSKQDIIFKTLSDKCVWSNLRKNEMYCAVPTEIPNALYPDEWYKGSVSFVDQIWHLNTTTGEVHLLANPLQISNKLVDAIDLTLDPKDDTLYFINKRDLTLWALDLNQ